MINSLQFLKLSDFLCAIRFDSTVDFDLYSEHEHITVKAIA